MSYCCMRDVAKCMVSSVDVHFNQCNICIINTLNRICSAKMVEPIRAGNCGPYFPGRVFDGTHSFAEQY